MPLPIQNQNRTESPVPQRSVAEAARDVSALTPAPRIQPIIHEPIAQPGNQGGLRLTAASLTQDASLDRSSDSSFSVPATGIDTASGAPIALVPQSAANTMTATGATYSGQVTDTVDEITDPDIVTIIQREDRGVPAPRLKPARDATAIPSSDVVEASQNETPPQDDAVSERDSTAGAPPIEGSQVDGSRAPDAAAQETGSVPADIVPPYTTGDPTAGSEPVLQTSNLVSWSLAIGFAVLAVGFFFWYLRRLLRDALDVDDEEATELFRATDEESYSFDEDDGVSPRQDERLFQGVDRASPQFDRDAIADDEGDGYPDDDESDSVADEEQAGEKRGLMSWLFKRRSPAPEGAADLFTDSSPYKDEESVIDVEPEPVGAYADETSDDEAEVIILAEHADDQDGEPDGHDPVDDDEDKALEQEFSASPETADTSETDAVAPKPEAKPARDEMHVEGPRVRTIEPLTVRMTDEPSTPRSLSNLNEPVALAASTFDKPAEDAVSRQQESASQNPGETEDRIQPLAEPIGQPHTLAPLENSLAQLESRQNETARAVSNIERQMVSQSQSLQADIIAVRNQMNSQNQTINRNLDTRLASFSNHVEKALTQTRQHVDQKLLQDDDDMKAKELEAKLGQLDERVTSQGRVIESSFAKMMQKLDGLSTPDQQLSRLTGDTTHLKNQMASLQQVVHTQAMKASDTAEREQNTRMFSELQSAMTDQQNLLSLWRQENQSLTRNVENLNLRMDRIENDILGQRHILDQLLERPSYVEPPVTETPESQRESGNSDPSFSFDPLGFMGDTSNAEPDEPAEEPKFDQSPQAFFAPREPRANGWNNPEPRPTVSPLGVDYARVENPQTANGFHREPPLELAPQPVVHQQEEEKADITPITFSMDSLDERRPAPPAAPSLSAATPLRPVERPEPNRDENGEQKIRPLTFNFSSSPKPTDR